MGRFSADAFGRTLGNGDAGNEEATRVGESVEAESILLDRHHQEHPIYFNTWLKYNNIKTLARTKFWAKLVSAKVENIGSEQKSERRILH